MKPDHPDDSRLEQGIRNRRGRRDLGDLVLRRLIIPLSVAAFWALLLASAARFWIGR